MLPESIIAGSGRGLFFAEMLIRDLKMPVVAMVETNTEIHPQVRQRLAEYGSPDTVLCRTLAEAHERFPRADRVFIATPNTTHADLFEEALQANFHVMLEKPVAAHPADVDRLERLGQATDRVIQLGFVLRYSNFYRRIAAAVKAGQLGQILMIQMNERLGALHGTCYRRGWRRLIANTGGFLNEKCSHDLDLMCWFKSGQARPVSVYSVGGRQLFERDNTPESCPVCADRDCPFRAIDRKIHGQQYQQYVDEAAEQRCVYRTDADVLNHQHVTVNFSDGTHGHLGLIAESGAEGRDIMIHGTRGFLAGDLGKGQLTLVEYGAPDRTVDLSMEANNMHGGGDLAILQEFFDCIADGTHPAATLADGILATRIAFAADRSVATGLPVAL
ncbi:Gfo/Idh/MocA family protein [Victivallis sp. Marseille-Q1083]|uniref:Gfo/Idh/MocA family protein n=1 Tax=Victivallis sp. Marseille-Q1083 TaxID=2717288 RepID=UPI00158C361E|nr:Gfo/Idh/MocA family oxidoreductase [Victivallis sp. Marseille-Q1083]